MYEGYFVMQFGGLGDLCEQDGVGGLIVFVFRGGIMGFDCFFR